MALRDWLLIVLLGAIWGTSFLFNSVLLQEIGPLWVSSGRVGFGALGCWVFFLALKKQLPTNKTLYIHFVILGSITYAIPFTLFPLAQQNLTSGVTAIINAMTPIMTVLVSQFWPGGERASRRKIAGVIAGFLGVAVLASPALSSGGSSQIWAVGLGLLATSCYAIGLNYTRSLGNQDASVLAACALTGATLVAVPVAFFVEGPPMLTSVEGWGAMMGISLVATAFALQIMYRILPRVGATNFTVTTFIAPVFAIMLGIKLLGEAILLTHIIGMAGIFAGLLLLDGRLLCKLAKFRA